MNSGNGFEKRSPSVTGETITLSADHPAWRALIRYCRELRHGEIEVLKIQDGLPVLAEVTKKKVKFAP